MARRQHRASVVLSKLVQGGETPNTVFPLCPCDQLSATTATARACFFQGAGSFNSAALEQALHRTLQDLPFLGGRMVPPQGLKLGSLHIALNGAGALLTLAEAPGATLADAGPDTWPMHGFPLSQPPVPWYLDEMDGFKVLKGKEALMKVRLTRLADGDILGITLSHAITDGMRWPSLLAHFAARYKEAATGIEAPPALLLSPASRAELCSASLAAAMACDAPGQPPVRASLRGYCRAGALLARDAYRKRDLVILHVPKGRIQMLKAEALGAGALPTITSGDVIQALSGLLVAAANGAQPHLLPLAPRHQVVLVQLQGVPARHLGNAVHLLPVTVVPEPPPALPADDYKGCLAQLASAIRSATADFRARPEASVAALAKLERLVSTPAHRMLGWLAGHRLPNVTCTTNYIGALPGDKDLDFGFGQPAATRWLVMPFGSDMAVVRPAQPPYGEGIFVHIPLSRAKAAHLREHPLLASLAPEARFLGSGAP